MKKKDIMFSYHRENSEDRFEFMYEHYYYHRDLLKCRKAGTIYLIEKYMSEAHWKDYCEKYNSQNRKALITKISECMDKGETIDFMLEGEGLPDTILEHYKAYTAMKIDFRIFSYALESIGGADEELIRRYIMNDIDLTGIAEERTISYQTAKGKIRDLKKLLKERTICYLQDSMAS